MRTVSAEVTGGLTPETGPPRSCNDPKRTSVMMRQNDRSDAETGGHVGPKYADAQHREVRRQGFGPPVLSEEVEVLS